MSQKVWNYKTWNCIDTKRTPEQERKGLNHHVNLSDIEKCKELNEKDKALLIKLINNDVRIKNCGLDDIGRAGYLNIRAQNGMCENITFPYLEELKFSTDCLSEADVFFINSQPTLKNLEILADLTEIPNLSNLSKLENIDLSINKIKTLEGFGDLKKLKSLQLRYNEISEIRALGDLKSLEDLDLSHNNLTSSAGFEHLSALKNLKYLNLSENKITSLEEFDKLAGCENLTRLDLSRNQITDIYGLKPISHIPNIKSLNLSYNKITELNVTRDIPSLTGVSFGENPIPRITALKNLSSLEFIGLDDCRFNKLENLSNLPCLKRIDIERTPVEKVSELETLPKLEYIGEFQEKFMTPQELKELKKDLEPLVQVGFELEWTRWGNYGHHPENWFIAKRQVPEQVFQVNEHLSLKLIDNQTILYVDDQKFEHCATLLLTIPKKEVNNLDQVDSIDKAAEILKDSHKYLAKKPDISPETQFWAHCSNIQAWTEHNYDSRILHRNLAFPLLKKLTELGDPIAKRVFKEEIAKRYASGHPSVVKYLKNEGYLQFLSENELKALK